MAKTITEQQMDGLHGPVCCCTLSLTIIDQFHCSFLTVAHALLNPNLLNNKYQYSQSAGDIICLKYSILVWGVMAKGSIQWSKEPHSFIHH